MLPAPSEQTLEPRQSPSSLLRQENKGAIMKSTLELATIAKITRKNFLLLSIGLLMQARCLLASLYVIKVVSLDIVYRILRKKYSLAYQRRMTTIFLRLIGIMTLEFLITKKATQLMLRKDKLME